MNKIKAVLRRLLLPSGWILAFVSGIGYGTTIRALVSGKTGISAYIAYALSAYALAADILALPKLKSALSAASVRHKESGTFSSLIRKTKFGIKYLDDQAFRGSVSVYQSMIVNFLHTIFRIITGIKYASVWFISMAAYYFFLGIIRAYIVFSYRRRSFPSDEYAVYEYGIYKTTGKLLLSLNIPMSVMIFLTIVTNSGYIYPGIVIYGSATYTFYMTAISILNISKFRKLNSPILLASKNLNFVSAAMSLFGLQTAMISRFGDGNDDFRKLMNFVTGAGVCVITLGAAVYMIVKSQTKIRKAERI